MTRELTVTAVVLLVVSALIGCDDELPTSPVSNKLSGTIVAVADSTPISWAEVVVVEGRNYLVVAGPVRTDSSGAYRFSNLPEGEFYVLVFHSEFLMFDRTVRSVVMRNLGDVRQDFRMIRATLWNGDGYRIQGTVRDSLSRAPIAGAFVSGFFARVSHSFRGISLPDEAVTDSVGRFTLEGVPTAMARTGEILGLSPFAVSKEGYLPFMSAPIPIPEPPDSTAEAEVLLVRDGPTGELSGRVVYRGVPLPDVRVAVDFYDLWWLDGEAGGDKSVREGVPLLGRVVTTDSEGRYEFPGLAPGFYTVEPAYLPDDGYVAPMINVESQVELEAGQSIELPDLHLAKALEPISPARGSVVSGDSLVIEWEPSPDADRYELWMTTGHVFGLPREVVGTNRLVLPGPLAAAHIRWEVDALRGDSLVGAFEETATFKTMP